MMYRIEFRGALLPGFEPEAVRAAVGARLKIGPAQVARMFSGQAVVLKKSVSEGDSKAYLDELAALGLHTELVPLAGSEPQAGLTPLFKVVFWGRVLPGFERTAVMAAAARRLKVPPALLLQIFSGSKVVLKRGVDAARGARLVVELAMLGMQIELEADVPADLSPAQPAPADVPELPAAADQDADPQYGALLRTACDLSGTPFAGFEAGAVVAPDDDAEAPVAVPEPPKMPKAGAGIAAANAADHVNCPNCGAYQPRAAVCVKCGEPLPQARLYVGRAAVPSGAATVLAEVAEREAPRKGKRTPSLHSELARQGEVQAEEARARGLPGWAWALAGALGVLVLGLLWRLL